MNRNFASIKKSILGVIGDTNVATESSPTIRGALTSADLLLDAVNAALSAITSRVFNQKTVELEGSLSAYDLPDDLIAVEGVLDKHSTQFVPEILVMPHQDLATNAWTLYGAKAPDTDYGLIYPKPQINFLNPLPAEGATVYYSALWGLVAADADQLEPPAVLAPAIILYGASFCLLASAVASANIRQFDTKVDSGTPVNLPHKDMSDYLMKRFELELSRVPATKKGVTN